MTPLHRTPAPRTVCLNIQTPFFPALACCSLPCVELHGHLARRRRRRRRRRKLSRLRGIVKSLGTWRSTGPLCFHRRVLRCSQLDRISTLLTALGSCTIHKRSWTSSLLTAGPVTVDRPSFPVLRITPPDGGTARTCLCCSFTSDLLESPPRTVSFGANQLLFRHPLRQFRASGPPGHTRVLAIKHPERSPSRHTHIQIRPQASSRKPQAS